MAGKELVWSGVFFYFCCGRVSKGIILGAHCSEFERVCCAYIWLVRLNEFIILLIIFGQWGYFGGA